MSTGDASARYAVISSDGHAGGELYEYRDYLASQWHDDFDAWARRAGLLPPVQEPPHVPA